MSLLFLVCTAAYGATSQDEREGYLWDTAGERDQIVRNLALVPRPPPTGELSLRDRILNRRLVSEFEDQYRVRFGYSDAQQAFEPAARSLHRLSAEIQYGDPAFARARKREFGEYMVRRVVEHEVDSYFRSEPRLRRVYEMKERISSASVEVKPGYKFDLRYHFAGNYATLDFNNPILGTQLRADMNSSSFGPSDIQEYELSFNKNISPTLGVQAHYKFMDQVFSLVGSKQINEHMATSLTGTMDQAAKGTRPAENSVLAGVSVVY